MAQLLDFIIKHSILSSLLVAILVLWMLYELLSKAKKLNSSQVVSLLNKDLAVLIDIRSMDQFVQQHIKGSHNVPLSDISSILPQLAKKHLLKKFIIISEHGAVPTALVQTTAKLGVKVFSLSGGINAWLGDHLPVVSKQDDKNAKHKKVVVKKSGK